MRLVIEPANREKLRRFLSGSKRAFIVRDQSSTPSLEISILAKVNSTLCAIAGHKMRE